MKEQAGTWETQRIPHKEVGANKVKSQGRNEDALGVGLAHSRESGQCPATPDARGARRGQQAGMDVAETPSADRGAAWVQTKLAVLAAMARQDPRCKFTNLAHLLTEGYLRRCFQELRKNAAPGADGKNWCAYAENLEANLADLVQRLKEKKYWPQPVRRVYIPKGQNQLRPLGIPAIEDKVVQLAMTKILQAIYEADFYSVSYGFRPGKGCHQALKALEDILMGQPVNYVVDADIKSYFDSADHDKMLTCLRQRITDRSFLKLVERMLTAGIVEDGKYQATERGTPQGGNLSPMLANIFLHYVLDRWFERGAKQQLRGYAALLRYADDFVICVKHQEDAQRVLQMVEERFAKCGLSLSPDKTKVVEFGRYAVERAAQRKERPGSFAFLGFLHHCAKTRDGKFKVGRKTSPKRFCAKLREVRHWLAKVAHKEPMRVWWPELAGKLIGHYGYYGIAGNAHAMRRFYDEVTRLAYQAANRRSQRQSFNWKEFRAYRERFPLPAPRKPERQWDLPSTA